MSHQSHATILPNIDNGTPSKRSDRPSNLSAQSRVPMTTQSMPANLEHGSTAQYEAGGPIDMGRITLERKPHPLPPSVSMTVSLYMSTNTADLMIKSEIMLMLSALSLLKAT